MVSVIDVLRVARFGSSLGEVFQRLTFGGGDGLF
jgi:hypothetical protein